MLKLIFLPCVLCAVQVRTLQTSLTSSQQRLEATTNTVKELRDKVDTLTSEKRSTDESLRDALVRRLTGTEYQPCESLVLRAVLACCVVIVGREREPGRALHDDGEEAKWVGQQVQQAQSGSKRPDSSAHGILAGTTPDSHGTPKIRRKDCHRVVTFVGAVYLLTQELGEENQELQRTVNDMSCRCGVTIRTLSDVMCGVRMCAKNSCDTWRQSGYPLVIFRN